MITLQKGRYLNQGPRLPPVFIPYQVEATNKKVDVYWNERLVGRAGVVRKEDFDLDALVDIALAKGALTEERVA